MLLRGWHAWRRHRERQALRRRAIPDQLWQQTLLCYPFLSRRDTQDLDALRRLSSLFLDRKEFTGAGGFEVSDEIALAVAAQASLPVLKLGLDAYNGFVGIVMHADEVLAPREVVDENGVVHRYRELLSGEAMEGGPVMLSWADVSAAGSASDTAYNVVIHEFAHVLDMATGEADGMPALPNADAQRHWRNVMQAEYEQLCRWVDDGRQTVLDPYGTEAPAEFFAVAAEAFFVTPEDLHAQQPALYRLLAGYFRQDPAQR